MGFSELSESRTLCIPIPCSIQTLLFYVLPAFSCFAPEGADLMRHQELGFRDDELRFHINRK